MDVAGGSRKPLLLEVERPTIQATATVQPLAPKLSLHLIRKLLLRLMPILMLGYGLSFVDRSNLSYANLDEHLKDDVPGLVPGGAAYGLAAGFFFLGYSSMQIPVVYLISRVGARRVLAAALLLWGAIATAQAAVTCLEQLYLLRLGLGIAEAGYYPGSIYFLSTWLPDELLGTASTLFTSAGSPLSVVGSVTAGLIMSTDAFDGLLGLHRWRWLFLLQGGPSVLVGLLLLLQLPDKPSNAHWLTEQERSSLLARLASRWSSAGAGATTSTDATAASTADGAHAIAVAVEPLPPLASPSTTRPPTTPAGTVLLPCYTAPHTPSAAAPSGPSAPPNTAAPPPLSLCASLRRTVQAWPAYLFAFQHFCGATTVYTTLFFQPLMLTEILPTWSDLDISLLQSIPLVSAVLIGPAVSWWGDQARHGAPRVLRRVRILWAVGLTSSAITLLSGVLLVFAGGGRLSAGGQMACSIAALVLGGLTLPLTMCGAGPLWALHHAAQPKELHPTSISFINAIGNLGGFVGPYMLGALKGPLGPPCPTLVDGEPKCVTQWGGAIAAVGGLMLLVNLVTVTIACTALLPRLGASYRPPAPRLHVLEPAQSA